MAGYTPDPRSLERISRLELKARRLVEGIVAGQHRSPFKGFSIEFADHREYVAGDDLRYLDWKVFAKSDKHYIKQYEEETNLDLLVVLDASESMKYGEGETSKWEVAKGLCAALAYLVSLQQDMAGLVLAAGSEAVHVPQGSSRAHLHKVLMALDRASPAGTAQPEAMANLAASHLKRRGIVVWVGDFFAPTEELVKGLRRLGHSGHEVMALQVMHRDEIEFPFTDYTRFDGLEATGQITLQPQSLRAAYRKEAEAFVKDTAKAFARHSAEHQLVITDEPLDAALARLLAQRGARNSQRR
ncbi:MAG: DUF58 domain-containing protein [Planctomycetota bacterium]